jgi:hypothetical protein
MEMGVPYLDSKGAKRPDGLRREVLLEAVTVTVRATETSTAEAAYQDS